MFESDSSFANRPGYVTTGRLVFSIENMISSWTYRRRPVRFSRNEIPTSLRPDA